MICCVLTTASLTYLQWNNGLSIIRNIVSKAQLLNIKDVSVSEFANKIKIPLKHVSNPLNLYVHTRHVVNSISKLIFLKKLIHKYFFRDDPTWNINYPE